MTDSMHVFVFIFGDEFVDIYCCLVLQALKDLVEEASRPCAHNTKCNMWCLQISKYWDFCVHMHSVSSSQWVRGLPTRFACSILVVRVPVSSVSQRTCLMRSCKRIKQKHKTGLFGSIMFFLRRQVTSVYKRANKHSGTYSPTQVQYWTNIEAPHGESKNF